MFKIGDKVKIRQGLVEDQKYGGIRYFDSKHFDGVGSVSHVAVGCSGNAMWYNIDGHPWAYTDDMLIPVPVAHKVTLSKKDRMRTIAHRFMGLKDLIL